MESVQPPAGSQTSHVPAQRTPPGQPVQPGPAPVGPAAPPAPKRRRRRLVWGLLGGLVAAMLLGAGAVVILYDRATAPDRSAPDVVVDNYLRAYLVDRNDVRAQQYTCDPADLADLERLRTDLQAREQRFQTNFTISWGRLSVGDDGDMAEVSVNLVISTVVNDFPQSDRQSWRFVTRKGSSWRVCEAHPAA